VQPENGPCPDAYSLRRVPEGSCQKKAQAGAGASWPRQVTQKCKTWMQRPWVKKTGPVVSSAGNLFLGILSSATLSWETLGCGTHLCPGPAMEG